MAKYYNTEHTHPFSWEQVCRAIFQRYPNPFASHVLSEDTVYREVINGTVLYSRRFLTKTNKIPKWGEYWLSGFARRVPLIEESYVDNVNRTITTYTRNVGLSNFMTVAEKVVYKANPENPEQTIALKEAWVESRFYGLRSAIKNFGIERFKNNCVKATEGFNVVLERLHNQQHNLSRMRLEKLEELQIIKDQLKTQCREKTESLKEKSSQQWNQAKEKSSQQWNQAKETAKKAAHLPTLHAAENEK